MLEQRSLKLDLLALGLLAFTIFLGASLFSYDAADPPSTLVYPTPDTVNNACGRSGAFTSAVLFSAIGIGSYYLLLSLAVLDGLLLVRREVNQPVLRVLGWVLSLLGLTTLTAMAAPEWGAGPVIGPGGYLGAAGRGLMEMNFARIGAYILTVSVLVGGLLLCTDYLLLRVLAWAVGIPAKGLGLGLFRVGSAYAAKLQAPKSPDQLGAESEYDEEEEAEEDTNVAVVMPGRGDDEEEEAFDEDDELEEDEEEQEEEEEEEDSAEPTASLLRIRKPKKTKREELIEEINAATAEEEAADYELPSIELLHEAEPFCFDEHEKEVRRKAKVLERTFQNFGFNVRVVEIQTGPVIAQFEVELEAGLRLSRITGLADDLAIALRVPSVRIVAPIPGKNTVGIEVPNHERQLVRLREVMEETNGKAHKMRVPIYLGKDVAGNPMIVDLTTLPHLLIAGRTGTGKSVCLNSMIVSMIMTRRPDEVRMLLIDPKMVELSPYKRLPHLMHPVVTDMRKAEAILAWAVEKMEERYQLLARAGVRHVSVYNQLGEEELFERIQPEEEEERDQIPTHMPYIVIVADEMADLMMTAAKEVEAHIIRLAQKSRAVGIHLVLATQKPTVDVITGLIKSNLPARIAFQVASRTDSRVVLDEMGAEKLLGNGDMLFLWPGTSTLIRGQGTYLSDEEINRVIADVATTEPQFVKELVQLKTNDAGPQGQQFKDRDELYEGAVDVVVREGRGSVSLLQRALGIGYGRAARLIDYMEEDGFVGSYNGSQAREVLLSLEDWEAMQSGTEAPKPVPDPPPKPQRRSNKIQLKEPTPDPVGVDAEEIPEDPPSSRRTPTRRAVSEDEEQSVAPWEAPDEEDSTEEDDDWQYEGDDEDGQYGEEAEVDVDVDDEAPEDAYEYEYEYIDEDGTDGEEEDWEDEEVVAEDAESADNSPQGRDKRGRRWSAESA